MARKFLLSAQLRLKSPASADIANIVRTINAGLAGITAKVNINITQAQAQLNALGRTSTATTRNLTSGINSASDAMEEFGKKSFGNIRRYATFNLVTTSFIQLTTAISSGINEAIKFDREMVRLSQVTGISLTGLQGLSKEVTRLSTEFGISSSAILDVSVTLAQAGLNAKDVKTALEAISKTAVSATFGDIKNTTEASIAIMQQFGKEAKDLEGILGSINAVSAKYAVESEDIAVAVRRAGGAFQAAGGNLEEFQALFTSVRQTTRESAETIATGFRTIFTRLQRTRTQNFLKTLGIDVLNDKNLFVGPFEAIRKLSEALKDIKGNDPRFAQIVEELGGFRQISKVIPLITKFEISQQALNVALRGGNSLAKDAEVSQQALGIQLAKVKEEFASLVRNLTNNEGFRSIISLTLKMTSSFVKLVDALQPLLPLIAGLGAAKLFNNAGPFFRGAGLLPKKKAEGGTIRKFASGGLVPGSGNGDTVKAMLTPGEFVIRKKAVEEIGAENLRDANNGKVSKFARGGGVHPVKKIFSENSTEEYKNILRKQQANPKYAESYDSLSRAGIDTNGINRFVSNDKRSDSNKRHGPVTKQNKSDAKKLSKLTREFKFDKDIVTYSGLDATSSGVVNSIIHSAGNSKKYIGKEFTLQRFLSTSARPFVARDFARSDEKSEPVMLRIRNHKGQTGVARGNTIEEEILLPNRSSFKILRAFSGRDKDAGYEGEPIFGGNVIDVQRLAIGGNVSSYRNKFGTERISHGSDSFTTTGKENYQTAELTKKELADLKDYTLASGTFNQSLREGRFSEDLEPDEIKKYKGQISKVSSAIKKSQVSKNAVIYRGIVPKHIEDIERQIGTSIDSKKAIGKTFTEKAFASATREFDIGNDFADKDGPGGKVLKILLNAGQNALPINGKKSGFGFEKEVLLDKGAIFKILENLGKEVTVQKLAEGTYVKPNDEAFKTKKSIEEALILGGFDKNFAQRVGNRVKKGNFNEAAQKMVEAEILAMQPKSDIPVSKSKGITNNLGDLSNIIPVGVGEVTNKVQKAGLEATFGQIARKSKYAQELIDSGKHTSDESLFGYTNVHGINPNVGNALSSIINGKLSSAIKSGLQEFDINGPGFNLNASNKDITNLLTTGATNSIRGAFLEAVTRQVTGQFLEGKDKKIEGILDIQPGAKGLDKVFTGGQALESTGLEIKNSLKQKDKISVLGKALKLKRFATGGGVGGVGNSDSVPALLTPGEFVINKDAARQIGPATLHKMNNADRVSKFAKGGRVGFAGGGSVTSQALSNPLLLTGILSTVQLFTKHLREADSVFDKVVDNMTTVGFQFGILNSSMKGFVASKGGGIQNFGLGIFDEGTQLTSSKARDERRKGISPILARASKERADLISNKKNADRLSIADLQSGTISQSVFDDLKKKRGDELRAELTKSYNANKKDIKATRQSVKDRQSSGQRTRENAFNTLSAVGGVAAFSGGIFSDVGRTQSDAGEGGFSNPLNGRNSNLNSGIGGALSGAGGGLAIGAAFGPLGAAAGAAAGGLYGFYSALEESTKKIEAIQFDKSIERFSRTLNNISTGKLSVQEGTGRTIGFIKSIEKEIQDGTKSGRSDSIAKFNQSSSQVDSFFQSVAKTSKTFAEFDATTQGTLRNFAILASIPYPELKDQIEKQIKAQNEANGKRKLENNFRDAITNNIISTNNMTEAITIVTDRMSNFGDSIQSIGNQLNGGRAVSQSRDLSKLFTSASEGTISNGSTISSAGQDLVGGFGSFGQELSAQAGKTAEILNKLPKLLLDTRSQGAFDGEGQFLVKFQETLEKQGLTRDDALYQSIVSGIQAAIGSEAKDEKIIGDINTNVFGVAEEVGKSAKKIFEPFKQFGPLFKSQAEEISKAFDIYVAAQLKGVEQEQSIFAKREGLRQFILEARGKNDTSSRVQTSFNERLNALGGSDAGTLSNIIESSQKASRDIAKQLSTIQDPNKRTELEGLKAQEDVKAAKAAKALDELATSSEVLTAVQKELSAEEANRQAKLGVVDIATFGGRDQQKSFLRSAAITTRAANLGINSIPQNDRGDIKSFLDQFPQDMQISFGKFTGTVKQLLDQFRNQATGGIAGDNGILDKGGGTEGEKLLAKYETITNAQITAIDAIQKAAEKQGENVRTEIETQNKEFLQGMRDIFFGNQIKDVNREVDSLSSERDLTDAKATRSIQIGQRIGLGNGGLSESNITDISSAIAARKELDRISSRNQDSQKYLNSANNVAFTPNPLEDGTQPLFSNGFFSDGQEDPAKIESRVREQKAQFDKKMALLGAAGASGADFTKLNTDKEDFFRGPDQRFAKAEFDRRYKKIEDDLKEKQRLESGIVQNSIPSSTTGRFVAGIDGTTKDKDGKTEFDRFAETMQNLGTQSIDKLTIAIVNLTGRIEKGKAEVDRLETEQKTPPTQKNATGGHIRGFGNRDTVPAMLTPGEYVLKQAAARKLGLTALNKLNSGMSLEDIVRERRNATITENIKRFQVRQAGKEKLSGQKYQNRLGLANKNAAILNSRGQESEYKKSLNAKADTFKPKEIRYGATIVPTVSIPKEFSSREEELRDTLDTGSKNGRTTYGSDYLKDMKDEARLELAGILQDKYGHKKSEKNLSPERFAELRKAALDYKDKNVQKFSIGGEVKKRNDMIAELLGEVGINEEKVAPKKKETQPSLMRGYPGFDDFVGDGKPVFEGVEETDAYRRGENPRLGQTPKNSTEEERQRFGVSKDGETFLNQRRDIKNKTGGGLDPLTANERIERDGMRTPVKRNAGKSAAGGAILGAVAAGPVGALAGAAIGLSASVYDSKYRSEDAARELAGFLGPDEKDYSHIERSKDNSRAYYTPEEKTRFQAGQQTFREEKLKNTKALDGQVNDIYTTKNAETGENEIKKVDFQTRHKAEVDAIKNGGFADSLYDLNKDETLTKPGGAFTGYKYKGGQLEDNDTIVDKKIGSYGKDTIQEYARQRIVQEQLRERDAEANASEVRAKYTKENEDKKAKQQAEQELSDRTLADSQATYGKEDNALSRSNKANEQRKVNNLETANRDEEIALKRSDKDRQTASEVYSANEESISSRRERVGPPTKPLPESAFKSGYAMEAPKEDPETTRKEKLRGMLGNSSAEKVRRQELAKSGNRTGSYDSKNSSKPSYDLSPNLDYKPLEKKKPAPNISPITGKPRRSTAEIALGNLDMSASSMNKPIPPMTPEQNAEYDEAVEYQKNKKQKKPPTQQKPPIPKDKLPPSVPAPIPVPPTTTTKTLPTVTSGEEKFKAGRTGRIDDAEQKQVDKEDRLGKQSPTDTDIMKQRRIDAAIRAQTKKEDFDASSPKQQRLRQIKDAKETEMQRRKDSPRSIGRGKTRGYGPKKELDSSEQSGGSGGFGSVPPEPLRPELDRQNGTTSAFLPSSASTMSNADYRPNRQQGQSNGSVASSQPSSGGGGSMDFSKFQDVATTFSTTVDKLTSSLANLSGFKMDINATHTVNVTFNGAEVLSSMSEAMSKIAVAKTDEAINKFVADQFPSMSFKSETVVA